MSELVYFVMGSLLESVRCRRVGAARVVVSCVHLATSGACDRARALHFTPHWGWAMADDNAVAGTPKAGLCRGQQSLAGALNSAESPVSNPLSAPTSASLLAEYSVGARVEMLYDENGSLVWYPGTLTRTKSAFSRSHQPDLSYSIRFDDSTRVSV